MNRWVALQQRLVPEIMAQLQSRYRILQHIEFLQPIGRRTLAVQLNSTERILRAEVDFLKDQGLVAVDSSGVRVTDAGRKLLADLEELIKELDGRAEMEQRLSQLLGIPQVIVVSGRLDEDPFVKDEMGFQLAQEIQRFLQAGDILAVTGGSTVAAIAERLPKISDPLPIEIVPARGGVGQKMGFQANSIAAMMAEKLGGTYQMLHLPDSLSDEAVQMLVQEPHIRDTLIQIKRARMVVHGIGQAMMMAKRRGFDDQLLEKLEKKQALAEAFGYYFDENGRVVHEMNVIGLRMADFAHVDKFVAVAGGRDKALPIIAVSRGIRQDVLVTDESCADEIWQRLQGGDRI